MGLLPLAFRPLEVGKVKAAGWLRRQLELQAQGLTGHLDEIWADVARSKWIGGDAEGWERGPYWLDGAVALAFTLDEGGGAGLKVKVKRWVDYILEHQHVDGWLGEKVEKTVDGNNRGVLDTWPRFVLLKALTQWQEATGDPRVIPAMMRFLRCMEGVIAEHAIYEWGRVRVADLIVSVYWLFERTGDAWLLKFAEKAWGQAFDWVENFAAFKFTEPLTKAKLDEFQAAHGGHWLNDDMLATHVVNNAMGWKMGAVRWRQSGEERDRAGISRAIAVLDEHHGRPMGMFSGDEHLAGREAARGTELCAVVEAMYSLEVGIAALGDAALGDQLELIAYNALPATISEDMWSHQYVQQTNQVKCAWFEERVYVNNSQDANTFGLEPNFGCCTANMHQGWPKFVEHLWMEVEGDTGGTPRGLAAVAWGPCEVDAEAGGGKVHVSVATEYPFEDEIHLKINATGRETFALYLRVPAWAANVKVIVDGKAWDGAIERGKFLRIERVWTGRHVVRLNFGMETRLEGRTNGSIAVHLGALVYALQVGEKWKHVRRELPAADFEVHPTTPWNVAVVMDPNDPDRGWSFKKQKPGVVPFSAKEPPCAMEGVGVILPEWTLKNNAADVPPRCPVHGDGQRVKVRLVPYGCARLRVAEMPWTRSK